jgi:hypothetical protein
VVVIALTFGAGLVTIPFVLGFSEMPAALWNSLVAGGLVSALAVVTALGKRRFWGVSLIGLYLVFAPFVFNYGEVSAALWSHFIAGVVLAGTGYVAAPKSEQPASPGPPSGCH